MDAGRTEWEVQRDRCGCIQERLHGVADALELIHEQGTEHDPLLKMLMVTCLQQVEELRLVMVYLNGSRPPKKGGA